MLERICPGLYCDSGFLFIYSERAEQRHWIREEQGGSPRAQATDKDIACQDGVDNPVSACFHSHHFETEIHVRDMPRLGRTWAGRPSFELMSVRRIRGLTMQTCCYDPLVTRLFDKRDVIFRTRLRTIGQR
jgi:hypothetical protein